jgi:acyl-CoA thioesterase
MDGLLLATVVQEGLIRHFPRKTAGKPVEQ